MTPETSRGAYAGVFNRSVFVFNIAIRLIIAESEHRTCQRISVMWQRTWGGFADFTTLKHWLTSAQIVCVCCQANNKRALVGSSVTCFRAGYQRRRHIQLSAVSFTFMYKIEARTWASVVIEKESCMIKCCLCCLLFHILTLGLLLCRATTP